MLATIPQKELPVPHIKRRTQKQHRNYGRGYFKIFEDDLIHQFNERFTYILNQQSRNVWRYFIFCDDYLIYTERCRTVHVANNKAYAYISSQIASQNKNTHSWSNL